MEKSVIQTGQRDLDIAFRKHGVRYRTERMTIASGT